MNSRRKEDAPISSLDTVSGGVGGGRAGGGEGRELEREGEEDEGG